MLYGSDYEVEDRLREWSGGRLKVEYVDTSLDTITRIPLGLELSSRIMPSKADKKWRYDLLMIPK